MPRLPAAHLALARDPALIPLLEAGPLPELPPAADPLASLIRSVNAQQLSVKAAAAIAERVAAATDNFDSASLLSAVPETLRALGLSWAKVRTVQAIAAAEQSGQIDFAHLAGLDDEAVIAALTVLPGIGRWTAEMFLLFALARPDVFSFGDLALRKALAQYYPDQDHAAVVRGWQPHRSYAARLLWRTFHVTPGVVEAAKRLA
ncbi:DNA-3-methyladenine glycosylase 2 family protein [Deinococcus detaillensis]|uniref:DNA-3-methyladenine glycosylase II n=1 Tax=Deinococcus detaillensis TaxID=2592048 RepID=A0A553UQV0_9DEIO|nr:DNA-3-methyladenine glycosylase [Deinococcus detaillensis]TSA82588.1 DNA-3-methyladenine glycosylase 2 family protein [Deinococcus detaillensis]